MTYLKCSGLTVLCIILQAQSALHAACLYGRLAAVKQLVESSQSSINSPDLQGRRPLHMAVSSQSSPNTSLCLRYLLERGADINAYATFDAYLHTFLSHDYNSFVSTYENDD